MPDGSQQLTRDFPNILVLGVGHSGTTVLNRMLKELGWNTAAEGDVWEECRVVRDINHAYLDGGEFDTNAAANAIAMLHPPWSIKDPRFVMTLHLWQPSFAAHPPLLLWLQRNQDDTARSYRSRGELTSNNEPGIYGHSVADLFKLANQQYEAWPGHKFALRYQDIAAAVSLFKLQEPA